MRQFSSYGPIDKDLHYYAPRQALINAAYEKLIGINPDKGGHYITVWAPRQTGKTWLMQQIVRKIQARDDFEIALLTVQSAKEVKTVKGLLRMLVTKLSQWFDRDFPDIDSWEKLSSLFTRPFFTKPLILILDEFDALEEVFINRFANEFRSMYSERLNQINKPSNAKSCLLHGLALIGVRSVLGIENVSGSPFNVQRSLHVPNLTFEEVEGMFKQYERESGQIVAPEVAEQLFYETRGHPGLTCWFGELLTEKYNRHKPAITGRDFQIAYAAALNVLPNNTILNIVSKAKPEPYRYMILEMFRTGGKIGFEYEDEKQNFLYMNGVIDWEVENETAYYARFPSPFVQKRLFNYFSKNLFKYKYGDTLHKPFEDLSDTITDDGLNIPNLLKRCQEYLRENRGWLLENAPRRKDLRIYEAVYHFNLYMYLQTFLKNRQAEIYPEFPTGNGQIDLIIKYRDKMYGLEVKSYTDESAYKEALIQAARYGHSLKLEEVTLVLFIERVDDANRVKYEVAYMDKETGVKVAPVFVEIGSRLDNYNAT